ncbi:hypothetical protein P3T76_005072 [Phytophthora citrophthora]|uniref:RxLR effector protein n=1 Tax=Phytophthora citrophthora TaxID=4793 RepID=A0AAD9GSG2_9STRA|nr:hypothetical protein P3T76_005072 [Phytophthora citrophthora]
MRLYYVCVLLAAVATLFASANALTSTASTKLLSDLDHSSVNQNQVKTGRSLRGNHKADGINPEERGFTIPTKVKLFWWREFKNKPNSYVKTKLGLDNLDDAALKKNKNYPLYLDYVDTREKNELWKLARRKYSTYTFWQDEGLDRMITLRGDMTFNQIAAEIKKLEGTEPFRIYRRYAKEFDQHRLANFGSRYYRETYFIDDQATTVEKFVRAQFWAEAKIRKGYVKEFLGIHRAKPEVVNSNPYYLYYLKMSNQLP